MIKIRIVSNPYNQKIHYFKWNNSISGYEEINYTNNSNSKLLRDEFVNGFFPFYVKDIVDSIISSYYVATEKIIIEFEGTDDEFGELVSVCADESVVDKVELVRTDYRLANARDILPEITRIFSDHLSPLILKSIDEKNIDEELRKFTDVSADTIPLCVLGNYSAGKSTFINSLLGSEYLPSGDEPITAKIYEIKRSPSDDRASIELDYENERFRIVFKGDDNELIYTGGDKPLYNQVKNELALVAGTTITVRVNKALDVINKFDKNDGPDAISNLIKLSVPFIGGILSKSNREFVIFDTPGSNSASNDKHLEVLKEQMHNLSNGLPIFLSEYDALDSTDNERLYKIIREVKELDSRFTMIIVNKADAARIPKSGFSEEEIDLILGMAIPKNLYTEGIYFMSSIVGLGSKNGLDFVDDHCAEVYDSEERKFSDPSSRFYKRLYMNNIMPEQLKKQAMEQAEKFVEKSGDYVYVNSGLYSVENEILTFADKYSHYNKCKQAYMFLDRVIGRTAAEISRTKNGREYQRKMVINAFESDKKQLISRINSHTEELVMNGIRKYPDYINPYVRASEVVYSTEQVEELETEFIRKHKDEKNYTDYQVEVLKAKINMNSNLKENFGKLFKRKNYEAWRELNSDLKADREVFREHKDTLSGAQHDVDRSASDELFERIKRDFTTHIANAQIDLEVESRNYWTNLATVVKNELVGDVTNSTVLTTEKKNELTELILSYEELKLDEIAENSFVRDDFERGIWIGKIKIVSSDRLNISKLVQKYNAKTVETLASVAERIRKTHSALFVSWIEMLEGSIVANVVDFNPSLRQQADAIQEVSNRIAELEKRQIDLAIYANQVKSMLEWSEI